jgi:hypothetical protein
MSEELTTSGAQLPAQAYNPAPLEITAEDIPTPRVKFAQGLSGVVTDGLVPYGAIYSQIGAGDTKPVVLAEPAKENGGLGPAVRFYVLGLKKGRSYNDKFGDLQQLRPGEPDPPLTEVKDQRPWNIYPTFDFTIALPELDEAVRLPRKLMLYKKWGGQAAKQIQLELLKAQSLGQNYSEIPFEIQAKKDKTDSGAFATAIVRVADVPAVQVKKDLEVVQLVAQNVSPDAPPAPAPAPALEAPALD